LALCGEARASHPSDLRPWLATARVQGAWARMDEAREALDRAERFFGPRPEIVAQRIALARLSGDLSQRRELLEGARDEARRCFPLWWEAVRLATDVGEWAEAERALRSPPATSAREWAEARVLHGQIEAARGHWSEALAHFRRALALDPNGHFQTHVEIARAALLLLDVELAREHMQRVLDVQASPLAVEKSPRFSRSRIAAEIGQMLDEVARDETLASRLRAIDLDSPDGQIAELGALAVAHPGHATTAIRLLRALRRRRDLRDRVTSGTGGIPKRIVQYWDSSPPPEVAALMRSWVDLNPDWDYRLFDDAAAIEFLRVRAAPRALEAYLGAVHAAQRADIFRLAYLAAEGGFYADADDRCLAPLASWAPSAARFVGYLELCGSVANDVLAATPHHPVIALALSSAVVAIERGENEAIWQSTGPGLLTRAFARAVAADAALLEDSVLLDLGALRRSVSIHCHLAYKKSDRHWARAGSGAASRHV
jgi:tetratricopeptide (TPR) repeat protein